MTSLSPKSNFLMFRSLPYLLGLAIVILATTLALWKSIAPFSLNTVLEFVGSNWNTGIDFGNPYSYAVMQNPIGFQIWHELGYRGTTSWFWLHFFALLVSFVLILIHLIRIHGFEKGVIAYSVTTCTTIFAMLFGWIGSYDAWTFFGMVLLYIFWNGNILGLIIATTYLGYQHYMQSLFLITASILASIYFQRRISTLRIMSLLLGWLLGNFIKILQDIPSDPRWGLLDDSESLIKWLIWKAEGLPYFFYSTMGALFILLLLPGELARLRRKNGGFWIIAAFLLALIPAVITNEPTRPFVLCIFLLTMWWISDVVDSHNLNFSHALKLPHYWIIFILPPIIQFDGHNLQIGLRIFMDTIGS